VFVHCSACFAFFQPARCALMYAVAHSVKVVERAASSALLAAAASRGLYRVNLCHQEPATVCGLIARVGNGAQALSGGRSNAQRAGPAENAKSAHRRGECRRSRRKTLHSQVRRKRVFERNSINSPRLTWVGFPTETSLKGRSQDSNSELCLCAVLCFARD
jgi:hypothetical protein